MQVNNIEIKPKSKSELIELMVLGIMDEGINANLNWIDTSEITDMSELFANSEFNGDISQWDVSNVTDMSHMFHLSEFNGDISNWVVKKVRALDYMFSYSKFEGYLQGWELPEKFSGKNTFEFCKVADDFKPKAFQII